MFLFFNRVSRRSNTVCSTRFAPVVAHLSARSASVPYCYSPSAHIIIKRGCVTGRTRRVTGITFLLMTTLVGIELNGRVCLAADSQITEDNLRTISLSTPKIVHVGKYLLGIVGDTRPGDILAYNWSPPVYKGADPVQWMGKKILPSILTAFKENNYDPYPAEKDKEAGFDYLVSFNGNLFHIACDLSFISSEKGIYGLGTGGQFALGYLYDRVDSFNSKNVERHAKRAVEIASVLDINTNPPIQIVTQERVI